MNIVILIRNFKRTGGAERYAVEVALRLLQNGYNVSVVTQNYNYKINGLKAHLLPATRLPPFLNSLFFSFFALRKAKQLKPDIIHSHERITDYNILTVHCSCYINSIRDCYLPSIPTYQGMAKSNQNHFCPLPFRKRILNYLKVIINPRHLSYLWLEKKEFSPIPGHQMAAVSNKAKNDILKNYPVLAENIHVVYPGVDMAEFNKEKRLKLRDEARKKLKINPDEKVILFVGSQFNLKGLKFLLQSIAKVKNPPSVCPSTLQGESQDGKVNFKLVIAGKGEDLSFYNELIEKLDLKKNVIIMGLVKDIITVYALGDIFVFPSLNEPFGISVLESMACGLPVIVSKNSGASEIIQDEENGLIIDDPSDTNKLADKIKTLLFCDIAETLGEKAIITAKEYSWDKTAQGYDGIIKKITQHERI